MMIIKKIVKLGKVKLRDKKKSTKNIFRAPVNKIRVERDSNSGKEDTVFAICLYVRRGTGFISRV
jgi:hypothetical protein